APSRTGLTPLGDGAVFGNDAGRVIRLDGAGRVLWTVETGGEIELPLVVTEDGVVAGVSGGDALVALDGDTGHSLCSAGRARVGAAIGAVGRVIRLVGGAGGALSFPARSGGMPQRRGWTPSLGVRPQAPPRGLVALEGSVLAIGPAAVLLLSAQDGALRWKTPVRDAIGAVSDGEQIWVVEQTGRLVALDRRSGAQRRAVPLGQR